MTIGRRTTLVFLAALAAGPMAGAANAAMLPWDKNAFRKAQAAGRPILIDIYADW